MDALRRIRRSSEEWKRLANLALQLDEPATAERFATYAWNLTGDEASAAIGLISSVLLGEPDGIANWMRRQKPVIAMRVDADSGAAAERVLPC